MIVFLFIIGYNIYDYFKYQKDCPKVCSENQDLLFWLNIVMLVLVVVLIIGYFFGRDKEAEKIIQNIQTKQINPVLVPQVPVTQAVPLNDPVQIISTQQVIPVQVPVQSQGVALFRESDCNGNPFSCTGSIDIISRI